MREVFIVIARQVRPVSREIRLAEKEALQFAF